MADKSKQQPRLLSLDILRGFTIAGMLMVNNPGSWSHIYAPLRHAEWNGITPTDLVFPFFMFIMGVSMYISYSKFDFKFSQTTFFKLLRRSALLFLIGLGLNYFGLFCRTLSSAIVAGELGFGESLYQAGIASLSKLRIMGVLQRLALVSFCGSFILLTVRQKKLKWIIASILLIYTVVMVGTESLSLSMDSIVAKVDLAIFGADHLYKTGGIPFDPEGLFSTIPCIAHVLIGVIAGSIMSQTKDLNIKALNLFIYGSVVMIFGFLWDYAMPMNKIIWSSSYVLVTCGLASLLLGLLVWIIDVKWKKRWAIFFKSFGVNPMAIFVMGGIISILISTIGFHYNGKFISIKGFIYSECLSPIFGNTLGSLAFAILFIIVCWRIAHHLMRKKIYIKI